MNSTLRLLQSLRVGDIELPNRVVMAALVRFRCDPKTAIPTPLHALYYAARASAGFIITGCNQISDETLCYPGAEGIYTQEQVNAWQEVTKAVHDKGGRIFCQLWHCGRRVHPVNIGGRIPPAPSPVAMRGQIDTFEGMKDPPVPREMTEDDIQVMIKYFRTAAENARRAGFDGVELHGANGYIVDEFLRDWTNRRLDAWGGSIENRCRFCLAVIDELIEVFGAGRVGIKLCPVGRLHDMYDSDPVPLFSHLLEKLSERKIAFVELVDIDPTEENDPAARFPKPSSQVQEVFKTFRPHFKGTLIANMCMNLEKAEQLIKEGLADAASFGTLYIPNPDLVEKFRNGTPIITNVAEDYWFKGGELGFTDLSVYKNQFSFMYN
eukprot:TRINITY_DN7361_c0_g1_i1.p1 TRINITY_DN7361_c0_g1~~TRINITY_DN7361_c0_g1_i1.p1  ORF type:complete len:380 (+),score=37.83 TRINITY_DN7361_c0_g1_i1:185-1324(+)